MNMGFDGTIGNVECADKMDLQQLKLTLHPARLPFLYVTNGAVSDVERNIIGYVVCYGLSLNDTSDSLIIHSRDVTKLVIHSGDVAQCRRDEMIVPT